MKELEKQTDSNTYRRIFEFIKREGIEPLLTLVNDLESLQYLEKEDIISKRLFESKDFLNHIVRKNKIVIDFLKQFKNGFLTQMTIDSKQFFDLVKDTRKNQNKLNLFIENTKILEDLKIDNIYLTENISQLACCHHNLWIFGDTEITGIKKAYSDGEILYNEQKNDSGSKIIFEEYEANYKNASWIIISQNYAEMNKYKYVYIKDFGFKNSNIPSYEELSSYSEPETLKIYKKNLQETRNLPF